MEFFVPLRYCFDRSGTIAVTVSLSSLKSFLSWLQVKPFQSSEIFTAAKFLIKKKKEKKKLLSFFSYEGLNKLASVL